MEYFLKKYWHFKFKIFHKFHRLLFLFSILYIFFSYFTYPNLSKNFVYMYLSKNYSNFYIFFILWIRDFIKEFWKIMQCFSKKYRHLKSKILHKFHRLLFFCSFSILVIFFSYFTYLNLSKNSEHFCSALLYGL